MATTAAMSTVTSVDGRPRIAILPPAAGIRDRLGEWGIAGGDDLRREPLYEEPLDALLASDDPLAAGGSVALEDLAARTWITHLPGNPIRDLTTVACDKAGFQPSIESVSNDFRTICSPVAARGAVALVPRSALRRQHVTGVVCSPSGAALPAGVCSSW